MKYSTVLIIVFLLPVPVFAQKVETEVSKQIPWTIHKSHAFLKSLEAIDVQNDPEAYLKLGQQLTVLPEKDDHRARERYLILLARYNDDGPNEAKRGSIQERIVQQVDRLYLNLIQKFDDWDLETKFRIVSLVEPMPSHLDLPWAEERTMKTKIWFGLLKRLARQQQRDRNISARRFREIQEYVLLRAKNFFNFAYLLAPAAPEKFRKQLAEADLPESLKQNLLEAVEVPLLHYQKIIFAEQKNVRKPKPGEPTWGEGRTDGLEFDEPYVPDPKEDSQAGPARTFGEPG